VNIIVVFICAAAARQLLHVKSALSAVGIIVLPLLLSAVLASRGEFLGAVVLAAVNYKVLFARLAPRSRRRAKISIVAAVFVTGGSFAVLDPEGHLVESFNRIASLLEAIDAKSEAQTDRGESIARPLMVFNEAYARFQYSPIIGSGYSSGTRPPFHIETQYFHNDWFWLAVTSGLVGVGIMIWILRTYCIPLGWITLLPFFVAGLTNTFMLNLPALMFYFFMVGVLREKIRARDRASLAESG
jgi:hypothetical protein